MSRVEQVVVPEVRPRSYYDLPVLKQPVWSWEVPTYFFTGGVAAGTALLAAGADLTGNADLARPMQYVCFASLGGSGALLVADLGVPRRFHHMLRVAKPTSPMSMGAWLFTTFAGASTVGTLSMLFDGMPRVGRAARVAAAALAPALATYTGVLIADTAVPVWHEARRALPYLFAAGAAASAGALGTMLATPAAAAPARRLALAGALAELLTIRRMDRQLGPVIGAPYRNGPAAVLGRLGQGCTLGGAVLSLMGRGRRGTARIGGALLVAGAVLARFAVMRAGRESAADPGATVAPQRARRDASGRA